ncbi:anthranilate synthase component I family protein [Streptomyces nitrosporeus]|uniref:Anthranilate synthase component I family protein n=1 Tax=Streptomyces nitrosporeus TaxID=28894 RepID=A0A5J6FK53_9ACTN|nr:chorismate-binding protein [Streptomyces nitrosporeus]QEU76828.1 anthranilate synthase component I family protein [Streptomyces nitrosporeus]GGZ02151.1 anthranilate synthase [Streptomyces nitrosporeus]
MARFGGLVASGLRDVTSDPAALDSSGFWAVRADFEGGLTCARFSDVRSEPVPPPVPGAWRGPGPGDWTSSLDRDAYTAGVRRIRAHIAAGEVYQANLCRVLSAPLPDPAADVDALTALLARGNPAPYAGTIRLPGHGVEIATASPELFLARDGRTVESGPIKGTGRTEDDLLEKDHAENVMIVDLVRNDLGRVCETGSVSVPDLCVTEKHPGLVHLVSTVRGRLAEGTGWPGLLTAAFPPGSVTGAPKSSALRIIGALETAPRGPYCGGIGWVDADRATGTLAVGIRSFWIDRTGPAPLLRFGTGAGITWGSDPEREWAETELKASRLLAVASGTYADACPDAYDDGPRGPSAHQDTGRTGT